MYRPQKSEKQTFLKSGGKGNSATYLVVLLQKIRDHDQRSQMYLRDDMADLYAYASEVRSDAEKFASFQNSEILAKLKRKPKTADQTLRAVMNLAYSAKLASARFRRIKAFWDAGVPAEQVRTDLKENGASRRRVRLEAESASFLAFKLDRLSAGTEVGLYVWATAVTPERLLCKIVDVLEYPDCIR